MEKLAPEIVDAIVAAHLEAAWAMAAEALKRQAQMSPLAVAMKMITGEVDFIPMMNMPKEEAENLIRHVVTTTEADFVLLVAEGSMVHMRAGQPLPQGSLHAHPERIDVVVARYRVKGRPAQSISRIINVDGDTRTLGDVIADSSKNIGLPQVQLADTLFDDVFERPVFMQNARNSRDVIEEMLKHIMSDMEQGDGGITLH